MERNYESELEGKKSVLISRTLIIGFVGGFLASSFLSIFYYFNFTEVALPDYLLHPWVNATWTNQLSGHVITSFITGLLSIILALIYFSLFRKIYFMSVGILFGIGLWIILFFFVQALIPSSQPFLSLSKETFVTTLSVFILYGVFVGYSIAYDYEETRVRAIKRQTER